MDGRLREGIGLFNTGRFFECHESLEDFYLRSEEEHKPFLEGLVQLAAACRIYTELGEVHGPIRMIRQAIIRLENYQPYYLGIRVKSLIHALERWTDYLEANGTSGTPSSCQTPKIRAHRFFES